MLNTADLDWVGLNPSKLPRTVVKAFFIFATAESVLDLAALQRLGVNPSELSRTISKAFTEMIFLFGDVHCDPHAANLLVRKKVMGSARRSFAFKTVC